MEVVLRTDPQAESLQQEGVMASSKIHDYGLARLLFREARAALTKTFRGENTDEVSYDVQMARVERDDGFNSLREGMDTQRPELIEDAYRLLFRSSAKLLGTVYACARQRLSLEDSRYVEAEAGASIGLLGRLATVAAIVGGTSNQSIEEPTIARHYYHRADGLLAIGQNRYYAASNAMNAARHERIFGTNCRAAVWVRKAARYTRQAIVNDRSNTVPALRTFARRLIDLRSSDYARHSVLSRP